MQHDARSVRFVGVSDRFYGDTLGLRLRDERPHAQIATAGETTLRVTAVGTPVVAPYTVAGWSVDDIAVSPTEFSAEGPDRDPRWCVGAVGVALVGPRSYRATTGGPDRPPGADAFPRPREHR